MKNTIKVIYKSLVETFFRYLYGNVTIGGSTKLISKIQVQNKFFKNKKYFIYSIKTIKPLQRVALCEL